MRMIIKKKSKIQRPLFTIGYSNFVSVLFLDINVIKRQNYSLKNLQHQGKRQVADVYFKSFINIKGLKDYTCKYS
jgi:hypothetical protein